MKQATQITKGSSEKGVLYFTSDKLAFFDAEAAYAYAATLRDKTVQTLGREEVDMAAENLLLDDWAEEDF